MRVDTAAEISCEDDIEASDTTAKRVASMATIAASVMIHRRGVGDSEVATDAAVASFWAASAFVFFVAWGGKSHPALKLSSVSGHSDFTSQIQEL